MTTSTPVLSPRPRSSLISRVLALITISLGLLLTLAVLNIIQTNVLGGMSYEGPNIRYAEPYEVCPGDRINYQVPITVAEPGLAQLGRDWCEANSIRCNLSRHVEFNNIVISAAGVITSTGAVVPVDDPWFSPGQEYEYRSGFRFSPSSFPTRATQDMYVIRFKLAEGCQ